MHGSHHGGRTMPDTPARRAWYAVCDTLVLLLAVSIVGTLVVVFLKAWWA